MDALQHRLATYTRQKDSSIAVKHDGDITGSVFGDDSTVLVDGVNNKIVGAVDTASLTVSSINVALGSNAGTDVGGLAQGAGSIAIGYNAGNSSQNIESVAIGVNAGKTSQGEQSVAIGAYAAITSQGNSAVAIGDRAGVTSQGTNAVAIGRLAGETNQAANSIVLNATGSTLENTTASSLVIKPIRSAAMTTILGYDAGTGEVTHNAAIPGYTNTADLKALVAASADFADYQTRIAAL